METQQNVTSIRDAFNSKKEKVTGISKLVFNKNEHVITVYPSKNTDVVSLQQHLLAILARKGYNGSAVMVDATVNPTVDPTKKAGLDIW